MILLERLSPPADFRHLRWMLRHRNSYACIDCGLDVRSLGEYCVVHDRVWRGEAMLGHLDGMMCIGCLELRIGRELRRRDFKDVPVNHVRYWVKSGRWPSRRFQERLGVAP